MKSESQIEITSLNYRTLRVGDIVRIEYSSVGPLYWGMISSVECFGKMARVYVIHAEGGANPNTWTIHLGGSKPTGRTVYKLVTTDETNEI